MNALAFDLGTTTLAASLIDCSRGTRLAMTGALNPQRRFGADVVSRLAAAVNSEADLGEMSSLVRTELLRMGRELCRETGSALDDITRIAIAGNPAMQHILMGLPVTSLAAPPYRPVYTHGTHLKSADLGWEGNAAVYLFPMPGGFVGGDTVAFLYGQEIEQRGMLGTDSEPTPNLESRIPPPALFLDMGTNGEIALTAGDTIWATSAAAGPAFEGGNLSCGMAALPGAISSVQIKDERLRVLVIDNTPPLGICGSAAIEAITELLRCNIIEANGRMRNTNEIESILAARVIEHQGANAFVLHRDAQRLILLTQSDIRQLQLAKSAIRAGIEVLAERSGIQCHSLSHVVLTGSFGVVLRAEWLKTIGIFDESMLQTTLFRPEGALTGVEKALADNDGFSSVEALAKRFKVVPLSGTPLFEQKFMRNMDFPRS